ncbi:MAG: DegQ family serine endoprotease [Gammaproteobacteria bacterium]|nr:DegQ family serine endoprotease [Gammaproteobacteria bacterium]MDH5778311.1 DegQ family serine endoprotease [Gammaproteobacteria bacterium]
MRYCLTRIFILLSIGLFSASVSARELPDFTKLVEANNAAVVNISTTQKIKRNHGLPPGMEMPDIPEGSPWGDLFRHFFEDGKGGGRPEEYNTTSLGSGFILDKDGYVVTNNHVVRDATEIIVRLQDRRELVAKVIGSDPRSDIALLKIEAKDLPVIKVGKSKDIKVGEWVMAIGSPFGFDHSVSVGVVSALGRNLPSESYVPFIQTDVAINPGNSGGPLFNLDGEVIGINAQIYSRTGGFMGLSFAIPMDVAIDVIDQLKSKGRVVRGWLGILIQDVNRELAESFGMKQPAGAVVLKVLPDSPAEKAGFKVGDVVVKFDNKKIHRSSDLPLAVGQTPVGDTVNVSVIREGKSKTLKVSIGELPKEEELAQQNGKPGKVKTDRLGIAVKDLTSEQRKGLGLKKRGIQVTNVDKGPAANAGIQRGDIILMLNNSDVKNSRQFRKQVKSLKAGKSVPVLIQRGDSPIFLALKIPK